MLALLPALSSADIQPGLAEVGRFSGNVVIIEANGQRKPLVSGIKLKEGMTIETGSSANVEVIFSNGSRVILTPDTVVKVHVFTQVVSSAIAIPYAKLEGESSPSVTELLLSRGKIIGQVKKLNDESVYVVKTPASTVRIHDVSVGQAQDAVYVVEYRPSAKESDKSVVACLRGFVETTVNGSNVGFVTVEPAMQAESRTPSAALTDSMNSKLPATAQKPLAAGASLSDPVRVVVYQIPAEEYSEITPFLEKHSTLPSETVAALQHMGQVAPPREQIFAGTNNGIPDKRYGRVVSGDETSGSVAKQNMKGLSAPANTTTGGSQTIDAALKNVIDSVNRAVEQSQVNSTPVGG